jgi:hypothetical protein
VSKQKNGEGYRERVVTIRDLFPDGFHVSSETEQLGPDETVTLVTLTLHTGTITTNVFLASGIQREW